MIHRPQFHPPPHIYPPDEWNLIEKRFMPQLLEQDETMFALGNGYLGMRGCFEEGGPIGQNGTFINGFYEGWPIVYPEEAQVEYYDSLTSIRIFDRSQSLDGGDVLSGFQLAN